MKDGDFQTMTLPNGIRVHTHKTKKMKTTAVRVFMHQNLLRDRAAKTALLPMVLRRGTQKHPSTQDITRNLERLYGAEVDHGVLKIGERHLVFIHLELANERFLSDAPEPLLGRGIEMLSDILQQPVMKDGLFREDYLAQEKETLRRLQLSLINDKAQYALKRCLEEMCVGERYGVGKYGTPEDLEAIDASYLTEHYKDTLSGYPMDVYVVGDIDPGEIGSLISRFFDFPRRPMESIQPTVVVREVDDVKTVTETQDVNQAKVALGFRTGRSRSDPGFWALAFLDGILGGFPHSKLFMNVREREGLAYYAFSRLEATKGLLTISCGIDFGKYQRVLDIINEQVNDLKNGRISNEEMDYTLRGMVSRVKLNEDSATGKILRDLESSVNGVKETLPEIIQNLSDLKREDIVGAAQGLCLDTVYLLTKNGQEVRA